MDENQVVKAVLAGDKNAFATIIDKYKNPLYNTILRMIKNPHLAQDLTQEVFIKVYEQLPKYALGTNFKSWLYRIATNYCIDYLRKKQPTQVELEVVELASESANHPEVILMKKEKQRTLEKLVTQLPADERAIILMRYVNDLTYEEIAECLGLSANDVGNKVYRAKQKMRKQLKEGGDLYDMYQRG